MKFITIILAFYITLLTVKPCVDGDIVATREKEAVAATDGHSHEHHDDACSPFCICSCCGIHIINFSAVHYLDLPVIMTEIIQKPVPLYKSHIASSFSGSIWQPPQIV